MSLFDQEVLDAKRSLEGGKTAEPIAPVQVTQELQPEPASTSPDVLKQDADLLGAFDRQVQEAQEILEVSETEVPTDAPEVSPDDPSKRSFDSWFAGKYSGTKEFLEDTGETLTHLGYGALMFFPSVAAGASEWADETFWNKVNRIKAAGASDPDTREMILARIRTPEDIRKIVDATMAKIHKPMGEPESEGAKAWLKLAEVAMDGILFYAPKKADEYLTEKGYPNLGFGIKSIGEILSAKVLHSGAKESKAGLQTAVSRFKKITEDVHTIKSPADLDMVSKRVDALLDKLGIKEEERIVASNQAFKQQKDVGSWMEERAKVQEEVSYTKKVAGPVEGRKPVEVVGSQEQLGGKPSTLVVTELDTKSSVTYDPAKHKIVRPEKGIEARAKIDKKTEELYKETTETELAAVKAEMEAIRKKVKARKLDIEKEAVEIIETPEHYYHTTSKEQVQKIISGGLKEETHLSLDEATATKWKAAKGSELLRIKGTERVKEGPYETSRKLLESTAPENIEIKIDSTWKSLAKKPSIQKLNIEKDFGKRVAGEISDGKKVAEDMGIYETIRAGVEGKKKVGEIMKEIKEGRYYGEDLKDFGFTERDIRGAIRAVKVEEFGDVKVAKEIQTRLGKEVKPTELVVEKKPKPEPERVDLEHGRPPGAEADLKKYEKAREARVEVLAREIRTEAEKAPLRTAEGTIVKSKALAKRLAASRGIVGELVRDPSGKGWYVKKTPEMQKIEAEATRKLWDAVLTEEGTGKSVWDTLTSERGSVTISAENVKKLQNTVRKGTATAEAFVKEMQRRKVPDSEILKVFPNAFKETPVIGTSKWLEKDQDPETLLPRRVLKKGKKPRLAPAVTRGDAHVVSTFTRDLTKPWAGDKLRIATSEGLFTQMGRSLKETFLYPMRKAAKAEHDFVATLAKESNTMKKTFKLGTRQRHAERIETYSIAQQPDGVARLKSQGIKENMIPKKLLPKEQLVYDQMQAVYKSLYKEMNKAREASGETQFPAVKNYSPWFHDLSRALEIDRLSPLSDLSKIEASIKRLKEIPSRIDRVSRTPGMRGHEKFRGGPETPGFLHLNAFDNFETYSKIAGRTIHLGPTTAYLHELLLPRYKLGENTPNAWRFLSEWLDYQKGVEPIMFIENPTARRWIREGSSNVAVSYIAYAWGSVLNQVSSVPNSTMIIGPARMTHGMIKATRPGEFKRATRVSDILSPRSPETILMEAGRPYPLLPGKPGRAMSDAWKKFKSAGTAPLTVVDNMVAHATWLGAEAQGKRIYKASKTYKEMPVAKRAEALQEFSKQYADDAVIQAQGSAARAERAPIQRTAEGAAATTLQTFVIANYDLLKRQMLGVGHPDLPKKVIVQRITRQLIGLAAVGYAFDFMGMRSPNPRPLKEATEALDKLGYVTDTKKFSTTAKVVSGELLEYIPIYGGKFKYGSEFGGALVNELVKLGKGDMTAIPRLAGLAGWNQFLKSYRASKRKGTDVDVVFGRYVEKPRAGRAGRSQ